MQLKRKSLNSTGTGGVAQNDWKAVRSNENWTDSISVTFFPLPFFYLKKFFFSLVFVSLVDLFKIVKVTNRSALFEDSGPNIVTFLWKSEALSN
jgi:hypothetical protein